MPGEADDTAPVDPLEVYDELVMDGRAPDPVAFAAGFPQHPKLLDRIAALDALRDDLDVAAGRLGRPVSSWPEEIAGFRLLEVLGEGGMGVVFVAEQLEPKRRCAVKLLHSSTPAAAARFAREAQLMAALRHPGLAAVFDYGVVDDRLYLATELIAGRTLKASLEDGIDLGSVPHRVRMLVGVAEAVGHAHANRVVHRDIKPSNIMVLPDGSTKVIDFGLAVQRDGGVRVTRTGIFIGSYGFAAPEQIRGEKSAIGPWTDVYALGATLFEVLTNRPLFPRATIGTRLANADEKPAWGPGHFNPDVPRGLDKLVLKAVAPKPKKRFPDAGAMAEALRKYA